MTNHRQVLIYGLSPEEKDRLRSEGLTLKEVDNANGGGTLQELLDHKAVPHEGEPMGQVKIMIFAGYDTNDELKDVISKIRREHVFGAIMAVITKTNLTWRFDSMIGHLLEEREENRQIEKERRAQMK